MIKIKTQWKLWQEINEEDSHPQEHWNNLWYSKDIRDELIKIRVILDFDISKGKQALTLLIKELKGEKE